MSAAGTGTAPELRALAYGRWRDFITLINRITAMGLWPKPFDFRPAWLGVVVNNRTAFRLCALGRRDSDGEMIFFKIDFAMQSPH